MSRLLARRWCTVLARAWGRPRVVEVRELGVAAVCLYAGARGACACGQFYEVFLYLNLFCTCKDDMNILQSIVVLSSINVIFASTLGTVVSIVQ